MVREHGARLMEILYHVTRNAPGPFGIALSFELSLPFPPFTQKESHRSIPTYKPSKDE